MKTTIKQAQWKSKGILKHTNTTIVTNVFWQGDDAFIDTDSKFLFKMVCRHFFKDENNKLELTLEGEHGMAFSDAYRLYVYNLIYEKLTGLQIDNNILTQKDSEALFYQVILDGQLLDHQKRVLEIIQILEINFKKESDYFHRILFNTRKKKNFEISDIPWNEGIDKNK
jgi:hypothetical protein